MVDAGTLWMEIGALLVLAGLGVAAVFDLRTREVPDHLWQTLGVVGAVGGALVLVPNGTVAVGVWTLVALLALEHLFPWDTASEGGLAGWADVIELVGYIAVTAVVAVGVFRWGWGDGVPPVAVALLVTIIVARALFEAGVLYGGADAKALIIVGLLLPLFPLSSAVLPANAHTITAFVPFPVNLLMDAAVLSIVVPIAVALRNLRRGEFTSASGFTTYTIPVDELPCRFVWVRDPAYPTDPDTEAAIETSEEDRHWRTKVAEELRGRGVLRVRVGPQLPFIVLMFGGALGALFLGNWIIDLLAIL